jgi:uncharacterized membrane protein
VNASLNARASASIDLARTYLSHLRIYALPAWVYVGLGIDAGIGRCLVRRWNVVLSLFLALTCAVLFYCSADSDSVCQRGSAKAKTS